MVSSIFVTLNFIAMDLGNATCSHILYLRRVVVPTIAKFLPAHPTAAGFVRCDPYSWSCLIAIVKLLLVLVILHLVEMAGLHFSKDAL